MRHEHLDAERGTYYVAQSYRQYAYGLPKKGKTHLVDLPLLALQPEKGPNIG